MAVVASGKIEAYVGPPGLGTADDLETVIVDLIACACSKLSIAVQELDSEAIARAILAASWRGVHVELFLEQDYTCERASSARRNGLSGSRLFLKQARRPSRRSSPRVLARPGLRRLRGSVAQRTLRCVNGELVRVIATRVVVVPLCRPGGKDEE